jgi:hypothetical protein
MCGVPSEIEAVAPERSNRRAGVMIGNGDFAEVDTIIAGTGDYAGASGAWRASGTFQGSQGQGHYEGEICGLLH